MAGTTNPDTLKLFETIAKMDSNYLEMSEDFEWELASRDFRAESSNFFLTAYDKEVAKLGKSFDKFLHQDWLNNLTPEQKEAVEWATNQFKITGDRSYELVAEDPDWATILYENDWDNHAKPFFEGFDDLPLTYYELTVANLSHDLEGLILDNTPAHQDTLPESWDSLTSGSESDDELSTPEEMELSTSPTVTVMNLTDKENTHTIKANEETPVLNPDAPPFTPLREGPFSKGK